MVVLNLVLVVANTKFRVFSTAVARLDLVHSSTGSELGHKLILTLGTDGRAADEARPNSGIELACSGSLTSRYP